MIKSKSVKLFWSGKKLPKIGQLVEVGGRYPAIHKIISIGSDVTTNEFKEKEICIVYHCLDQQNTKINIEKIMVFAISDLKPATKKTVKRRLQINTLLEIIDPYMSCELEGLAIEILEAGFSQKSVKNILS